MRAGRVIADSDDSDEFSPRPEPLEDTPFVEREVGGGGRC